MRRGSRPPWTPRAARAAIARALGLALGLASAFAAGTGAASAQAPAPGPAPELRWKLDEARPLRVYRFIESAGTPDAVAALGIRRPGFALAPDDLDAERGTERMRERIRNAETIDDVLALALLEGLHGRRAEPGKTWRVEVRSPLCYAGVRAPAKAAVEVGVREVAGAEAVLAIEVAVRSESAHPAPGSRARPSLAATYRGEVRFDLDAGEVARLDLGLTAALGGSDHASASPREARVRAARPARGTVPVLVEPAIAAGRGALYAAAASLRASAAAPPGPKSLESFPLLAWALLASGTPTADPIVTGLLADYERDDLRGKRTPDRVRLPDGRIVLRERGPRTAGLALYVLALAAQAVERSPPGPGEASPRFARRPLAAAESARLRAAVDELVRFRVRGRGLWAPASAFRGENRPTGSAGEPEDPAREVLVGDYPSTHLAVLALTAARAAGVEIAPEVWEQVEDQLRRPQPFADRSDRARLAVSVALLGAHAPEGPIDLAGRPLGWGEGPGLAPHLAMTAAGLACLADARAALERGPPAAALRGDADLRAGLLGLVDAIGAASAIGEARPALAIGYQPLDPFGAREGTPPYTLFVVEQATSALAIARLGERDPWREAALWLVAAQSADGMWRPSRIGGEARSAIDSALALLALARAGLGMR